MSDKTQFRTLRGYLDFLHERGTTSAAEDVVLRRALRPLWERFQRLDTVETVRDEIRSMGTIEEVQRNEATLWNGGSLITGFDLDVALGWFVVEQKNDPNRTLVGFTPQIDAGLKDVRYVPPTLREAHLFFWIVLRMCRLQHELGHVTCVSS